MSDPIQTHPGLVEWLTTGRRGASSNAIVAHLTGLSPCDGAYPHDADDFGRCEALLDAVPSLRPLLPRMAEVNAYWAALAPHWDILRRHDSVTCSALLKDKLRPIEDADPDHARMGPNASIRFGGVIGFKGTEPDDEQFNTAVMAVWESGKASTSFIQRRLGIGYNAAARLIERMEELGIVSKADHVGKREVRSPETLRAGLDTVNKAVDAAGGDEKLAAVVLKTIIAAMKEKDAQNRAKAGKPPMKPDPTFDEAANNAYAVTADELRQFVERYEQLESEKQDATNQQKELMAEAKGRGYDTKVLKKVVALRKRKPDDIAEEEAVLEMYKAALGMA